MELLPVDEAQVPVGKAGVEHVGEKLSLGAVDIAVRLILALAGQVPPAWGEPDPDRAGMGLAEALHGAAQSYDEYQQKMGGTQR